MAEMSDDELWTDESSCFLQLSLPDNDQTWLYCLPESDPNTVVDLSDFLCLNGGFDKCAADSTLAQQTSKNRKTKLKHPQNKKGSCAEDSPKFEGNSNVVNDLSTQPAKLNRNSSKNDSRIVLYDSKLPSQLTIDESPKLNTKNSVNSSEDTTLTSSSDSWNISEHTLLANISAPKGFMDTTYVSHQCSTPDLSLFSKFNFNPNSVSTPTKISVCANKDKISSNPENINEPLITTYTLEEKADDTFNITNTISTSSTESGKTAEAVEELEPKSILESTYICEDSAADKLSTNNIRIIDDVENFVSTEDGMNTDELNATYTPKDEQNVTYNPDDELNITYNPQDENNATYNPEDQLNATITVKPSDHDDDSEEDSCYSSSSNIRSLGDVCDLSQLQPQKNSKNVCTLTKTRSEDSLCTSEQASSSVKPKKQYGSASNLGNHPTNQLAAERRLQKNQNYFLKKSGNQVALPSLSLPENNVKCEEKAIIPPARLSKIPRPQSKIPKPILKK